jgi:hypothetical protein
MINTNAKNNTMVRKIGALTTKNKCARLKREREKQKKEEKGDIEIESREKERERK